jgi:hypothetical protein
MVKAKLTLNLILPDDLTKTLVGQNHALTKSNVKKRKI